MRHHHDPSLLPPTTAATAPPGRARSALAALGGVAAVTLGVAALAGTGNGTQAGLAPAASGQTTVAEPFVPMEPVPEPYPLDSSSTLAPGAPAHTPPPTTAAPAPAPDTTVPRPPTSLAPAPAAPAPNTSEDTLPDPPDPSAPPPLPAGITVEVHPAGTTLVAGRATQATVRIRNATNQAFWVFSGCGVTWVALFDQAGNDVTDRTDAEPCGSPGHYFSPDKVPARSSLERVLPLTPLRTASGAHQVRAAWARDTGPGLIHYIDAPPVAVQVVAPS